jgi:hypothetical protein
MDNDQRKLSNNGTRHWNKPPELPSFLPLTTGSWPSKVERKHASVWQASVNKWDRLLQKHFDIGSSWCTYRVCFIFRVTMDRILIPNTTLAFPSFDSQESWDTYRILRFPTSHFWAFQLCPTCSKALSESIWAVWLRTCGSQWNWNLLIKYSGNVRSYSESIHIQKDGFLLRLEKTKHISVHH